MAPLPHPSGPPTTLRAAPARCSRIAQCETGRQAGGAGHEEVRSSAFNGWAAARAVIVAASIDFCVFDGDAGGDHGGSDLFSIAIVLHDEVAGATAILE